MKIDIAVIRDYEANDDDSSSQLVAMERELKFLQKKRCFRVTPVKSTA